MSKILSYHNSVKENLEKILEWADLHSECKQVDCLCNLVGAVDFYVSKLVESLPCEQTATDSEFVGTNNTKFETTFIIERQPDGSISVSGKSADHEFHWDLGKAPAPIFALSACVSQSLFRWWEKYDEFLPACRAELKLTSN